MTFCHAIISSQSPLKSTQALLNLWLEPDKPLHHFITCFQFEILKCGASFCLVNTHVWSLEVFFDYALELKLLKLLIEFLEFADSHTIIEKYNHTTLILTFKSCILKIVEVV